MINLDDSKTIGDFLSIGATVGTLAGWLPIAAAAASLFWTMIRIYESDTVQKWLNKRKDKTNGSD